MKRLVSSQISALSGLVSCSSLYHILFLLSGSFVPVLPVRYYSPLTPADTNRVKSEEIRLHRIPVKAGASNDRKRLFSGTTEDARKTS
jgi:hypothetical protein